MYLVHTDFWTYRIKGGWLPFPLISITALCAVCHIGTHLFLNRTNIAVTLCCILSNSETSSTGRIQFHSDAGRIRTCTSFLMDDLANRSANHYGTAPLQIQVVLSHHLTGNQFLRVLSIKLLYLSRHSRDSNPGTFYGQPVLRPLPRPSGPMAFWTVRNFRTVEWGGLDLNQSQSYSMTNFCSFMSGIFMIGYHLIIWSTTNRGYLPINRTLRLAMFLFVPCLALCGS